MTDALDTWQWRYPLPQGNPIDGLAWGNGTFAAVSRAGTVMTSTDATNWNVANVGAHLSAIRYVGNRFIAVGNYGSILTSPDALTWATQVSGTSHALLDVAHGNGIFVAVGQCDAIVTSPDGVSWMAGISGIAGKEAEKFYGVAFGNGIFVVVGLNGTIITSSDGTTWTDRSLPSGGDVISVCFGAGRFVAAANNGQLFTSTNGAAWTLVVAGGAPGFSGVDFVNGLFVAVGQKVANNERVGVIWTSLDGSTWNEQTSSVGESLFGTAYGNGMFMIGGFGGCILTSPDGSAWTRRTPDTPSSFTDIACGNGTFVAVGAQHLRADGVSRHPALFKCSDMAIWSPVAPGVDEPLRCVVHTGSDTDPGMFVVASAYGTILTSADGASWQTSCRTQVTLQAIARHDSTLVGVGGSGRIVRSVDPAAWSPRVSSVGQQIWLSAVTWGNGRFVAVGDAGTIVTSADDGLTWSPASSGSTAGLRGVAFGNGKFVAVGHSGVVLTSPDGQSWTDTGVPHGLYIAYGIIYSSMIPGGAGGFMAFGSTGAMATSPDGVTWTLRNCGTSNNLMAAAYGNGSFFAVGGGGTVLQAQIFAPLSLRSVRSSLRSPQKVGTRITWECTATGRPGLRYAFTVARSGVKQPGPPREKLNFQPQPRFVQTPDAPGTYIVTAYVRDSEGNVAHKSSAPFVVKARTLAPVR